MGRLVLGARDLVYIKGRACSDCSINSPLPSISSSSETQNKNAHMLQVYPVLRLLPPCLLSKSPLWRASSLFWDPFPSSVWVHVRCIQGHMQITAGDRGACLLPEQFSSGSYVKTICGKQVLTFAINLEASNRANSNWAVGNRAAS